MISPTRLLPTTFTFPKPANVETWKPIPSAPGYSASSEGQIRNDKSGRILRPTKTPYGYLQVGPKSPGVSPSCLVHRLVAEAFLGECPEGLEVDHKNGVRSDNRASNLQYLTHAANCRKGRRIRGGEHKLAKLTAAAALEIKAAEIRHGDLTRFAERFGVSVPAIRQVRNGKSWAWVG
ncbi:NUMOD4 motif-containing HNH endonuclease [Paludisphaera rhizosphaerae]|uniref:NUMOD4 motif-containing HNH endonuclease n=1 Tax=Paludisphaera rhizosphaerae TaxID=2711216 RepID=UPI00197FD5F8|nr:NUMOD4 motif-containing HNH endonuclease [Paludisphaera rhizosphaerae]